MATANPNELSAFPAVVRLHGRTTRPDNALSSTRVVAALTIELVKMVLAGSSSRGNRDLSRTCLSTNVLGMLYALLFYLFALLFALLFIIRCMIGSFFTSRAKGPCPLSWTVISMGSGLKGAVSFENEPAATTQDQAEVLIIDACHCGSSRLFLHTHTRP